ncbi:ankyrin repeat domain-containing protein [Hymenobacter sp. ASUV-10]|uniref:Ankyrin repeat domain-containing protein n=1 Tax=Hymenobacter aranciens TaxID=3063996 RepID=A0ABT9BC62_9BACT|nr:ankyrin repeat domain-containing protein [Hymenobacter sp. ASUV-10]MDO7875228.1 ankyrin repeat domain-containing protein [Hymenobacter sp. ASUV-10]
MLLSWGALRAGAQVRRRAVLPEKRPAVATRVDSLFLRDAAPYPFQQQDSLLLAAATNDVPLARRLLARGAQATQPYDDTLSYPKRWLTLPDWTQVMPGETPVLVAVQRGHLAMTDLLLRHSPDQGRPAAKAVLCEALGYVPNQVAIVERLLATGLPPDSVQCSPSPLSAIIGYNAVMRPQLVAARTSRPINMSALRRQRRYMMGARRYEPTLHPLRPDSVNLHLLRLLLAAGARPKPADLHQAIRCHEPTLARYLLTHGAEVNAPDPETGRTGLHLAVALADTVLLQLLLAQGAASNTTDKQGNAPLHLAARHASARPTALLLAAGAVASGRPAPPNCPDCADGQGSTPLHQAAGAARPATVRLLLAAGAPVNACDAEGKTPLHLATGDYASYYRRSAEGDGWGTPAGSEGASQVATRAEGEAVLRLLLAAGASPRLTDQFGSSPLHAAVANDDTARVALLLRAGADPNQPDQQQRPPLTDVRSVAMLRQLQAAGARFGHYASTVLLNPVAFNQPLPLAITAAALADGGDLCETTIDGDTPLHLAAAHPDADLGTVALYLAHGAELEAWNRIGETPLAKAVASGRPAMVQLLLDAGARADADPSLLPIAARNGSEALVALLLRYGARVRHPDQPADYAALLEAVQSSYASPGLVARLLEAGADPNVADSLGHSALHLLVRRQPEVLARSQQVEEWLDLSPEQEQARTLANQAAAAAVDQRLLTLARLLLRHGARPASRNAAGESVADALRATDSPACRQLLAELGQGTPPNKFR